MIVVGKTYTWTELINAGYTHVKSTPVREYFYGEHHWITCSRFAGKYKVTGQYSDY